MAIQRKTTPPSAEDQQVFLDAIRQWQGAEVTNAGQEQAGAAEPHTTEQVPPTPSLGDFLEESLRPAAAVLRRENEGGLTALDVMIRRQNEVYEDILLHDTRLLRNDFTTDTTGRAGRWEFTLPMHAAYAGTTHDASTAEELRNLVRNGAYTEHGVVNVAGYNIVWIPADHELYEHHRMEQVLERNWADRSDTNRPVHFRVPYPNDYADRVRWRLTWLRSIIVVREHVRAARAQRMGEAHAEVSEVWLQRQQRLAEEAAERQRQEKLAAEERARKAKAQKEQEERDDLFRRQQEAERRRQQSQAQAQAQAPAQAQAEQPLRRSPRLEGRYVHSKPADPIAEPEATPRPAHSARGRKRSSPSEVALARRPNQPRPAEPAAHYPPQEAADNDDSRDEEDARTPGLSFIPSRYRRKMNSLLTPAEVAEVLNLRRADGTSYHDMFIGPNAKETRQPPVTYGDAHKANKWRTQSLRRKNMGVRGSTPRWEDEHLTFLRSFWEAFKQQNEEGAEVGPIDKKFLHKEFSLLFPDQIPPLGTKSEIAVADRLKRIVEELRDASGGKKTRTGAVVNPRSQAQKTQLAENKKSWIETGRPDVMKRLAKEVEEAHRRAEEARAQADEQNDDEEDEDEQPAKRQKKSNGGKASDKKPGNGGKKPGGGRKKK